MLNNQDFTQERAKYLGGSDIGAILGLSKYKSAVDVWLEKTGKKVHTKDALPLRFGRFVEPFVAEEYARLTSHTLVHHEASVIHPNYSFLQGHVDRFSLSAPGPLFNEEGRCLANSLLECKTAHPYHQAEWGESGTDEVPIHYLIQCAWYLLLTQVPYCDIAVLFGNSDLRVYQIPRDQELEDLLLHHAVKFWEEYVLKDCPPPAKSEADYQQIFHKSSSRTIEATAETVELVKAFHLAQQQINHYELEISNLKQSIMNTMQDAEILSSSGNVIATWKAPKPSIRIDTKKLSEEHPEWVLPYQVPTQTSRRLLIKPI